GAVSGLFVVSMSLFGVGLLYTVLEALHFEPTKIPLMIVGYGFGASFVALFAQLGGGIYTKAADVGADLVGKVEAGIPEDDPRNPAVIADLVGDNVGDCAGRGADLFESTAAENIGAMILGAGLAAANPTAFGGVAMLSVILFPLVVRAFGLVASIIGIMVVKVREDEDPMHALNRGYMTTAVLAAVGFSAGTWWLLNPVSAPDAWWHAGLCGTAVATMGMLGTAAYILAMDTFGPITDNAGGVIEMSHQPEDIRRRTDRLDAVGNTTKALTKGYAIGSAALAAFLLFSAYLDELKNYGSPLAAVNIAKPEVFIGGLFGAMLVFFFSGLAIRAVGKAAGVVIQDVRDQFRARPGIMQGTEKPDYGRTVDIVTRGALKAMVVGDTVGDPFKDTAGPSLHVLIKLLATITLVLAPLFI